MADKGIKVHCRVIRMIFSMIQTAKTRQVSAESATCILQCYGAFSCWVLPCFLFSCFSVLIRIVTTSLGEERADLCAPHQPGHPRSLIRVFAVRMKKAWTLSYPLSAQRRLWSDWADAQADLSLRWAHSHIVGFVTRRLIRLFILHALIYVYFLFLLVSGIGWGLWFWYSLYVSINFFVQLIVTKLILVHVSFLQLPLPCRSLFE